MALAYKPVNGSWRSAGRDGSLPSGTVGFPADVWAVLQLTYTIGTTVTPDPDVELAAKLDAVARSHDTPTWPRLSASHAASSAGLFAYVDTVAMSAFHKSNVRSGHLIQISYDPGDVVVSRHKASSNYSMVELQLASCVVNGSGSYNRDLDQWEYTDDWDFTDSGVHFPAGVLV